MFGEGTRVRGLQRREARGWQLFLAWKRGTRLGTHSEKTGGHYNYYKHSLAKRNILEMKLLIIII